MDEQIDAQSTDPKTESAEYKSNIPSSDETTKALSESAISQKLLEHDGHGSPDDSMQVGAQDSGYNSSGSSAHHSPVDKLSGGGDDGELIRTRSRASSRTSISSIPASVLTNLPDVIQPMNTRDTQDYMYQPWDHHPPRAIHTIRQREAMFRKPSSVRAMQMHTEDEGDDEYHLAPSRRRGSQRTSDISIRSAGSSPFKRSPFYSPTGAVGKPKVKKEYPLVLLHCTLLPPSLPVAGLVGHPDRQKILSEVLPSVYWKRWKLLEENIGSGVLRDRGVLISHPEDMYDLLEERLLESLELQHPRLDHGHFLGLDEAESDREDRLAREDSSTEDEGDECPDCGARVLRHNTTRKWEVKVFAANGLMRAGAWAAAWKEMEKVDVEVGLWLPPDVRVELEKRMAEDSSYIDNGLHAPFQLQEPENMLVRTPNRALTPSPPQPYAAPHVTQHHEKSLSPATPGDKPRDGQKWDSRASKSLEEIDLHTLLVNYIRVLASDRRNIAIVFLSVLVVFVAINFGSPAPASGLQQFPRYIPEYTTSSVAPLQEPATQTWMENTISQALSVAVPDSTAIVASSADSEDFSHSNDFSDTPVEPSPAEPEEISLIATDSLPVESGRFNYQDVGEQELPGKDESDELPLAAADTLFVESTKIVLEEGEQERLIENELEQPSVTENMVAENTEILSEEEEEDGQDQLIENEPEELSSIATEDMFYESSEIVFDEEDQEQLGETESDGIPSTAAETLSVESLEIVSEEEGEQEQLMESELEELSPVATESTVVESTGIISEEGKQPTQPSDDELEDSLPTAGETPSFSSIHALPGEGEDLQVSETAHLEEPSSTPVSMSDPDDDQVLPANDHHDQHDQHDQSDEAQRNDQIEQHEPNVPNEENEENEI